MRFQRFLTGFLAFTLLVIAWGAYVRASGSGAGCGDHWPLCNGEVLPTNPGTKTLVELGHRLTSGLAGLGSIAVVAWAFRAFGRGSLVRFGAVAGFVLMMVEAAVGAGLVKFGYVADDPRLERAFVMGAHLLTTFLLLAAQALTLFWARGGGRLRRARGGLPGSLALATLGGLLVVGVTGAIAALGDTLFPAASLAHGLAQDLSPQSHLFLRLRGLHPILALVVAGLAGTAASLSWTAGATAGVRTSSIFLGVLVLVQLGVGLLNLSLLAPVPLQLVHLLLADAVWVAALFLAAHLFAEGDAAREGPLAVAA
jgi:cytochrome c oxidase assembly protein subunit 15